MPKVASVCKCWKEFSENKFQNDVDFNRYLKEAPAILSQIKATKYNHSIPLLIFLMTYMWLTIKDEPEYTAARPYAFSVVFAFVYFFHQFEKNVMNVERKQLREQLNKL